MRVLWDTNVVSYWQAGDERFRHSLQKAVADFGASSFFVSTVTTQELMVFARLAGKPDETYEFLRKHFTPLDFTESCALEAARLAATVGRPPKAKGAQRSERRKSVDVWQRDAAIAATASKHAVDTLLTANARDFAPFVPHLACAVREIVAAGE
jgi:predicted nucleic acid-binding protein